MAGQFWRPGYPSKQKLFSQFYKRLRVAFGTETNIGKHITVHFGQWRRCQGQFTRNILTPLEGNQGLLQASRRQ